MYLGSWSPAEWKNYKSDFINGFYCIFHSLIHDENVQVNGIVFLSDMTDMTMAHHTFWTLDEMKRVMKNWQVICFHQTVVYAQQCTINPRTTG